MCVFFGQPFQDHSRHISYGGDENINHFSKYRFTRDVSLEITSKKLRYAKDTAYLKRKGGYYVPLFERHISQLDLPQELKYLPIIESSLQQTCHIECRCNGTVATYVRCWGSVQYG